MPTIHIDNRPLNQRKTRYYSELPARDYSIFHMMIDLLPMPRGHRWTRQERDDWIAAFVALSKLYISIYPEGETSK